MASSTPQAETPPIRRRHEPESFSILTVGEDRYQMHFAGDTPSLTLLLGVKYVENVGANSEQVAPESVEASDHRVTATAAEFRIRDEIERLKTDQGVRLKVRRTWDFLQPGYVQVFFKLAWDQPLTGAIIPGQRYWHDVANPHQLDDLAMQQASEATVTLPGGTMTLSGSKDGDAFDKGWMVSTWSEPAEEYHELGLVGIGDGWQGVTLPHGPSGRQQVWQVVGGTRFVRTFYVDIKPGGIESYRGIFEDFCAFQLDRVHDLQLNRHIALRARRVMEAEVQASKSGVTIGSGGLLSRLFGQPQGVGEPGGLGDAGAALARVGQFGGKSEQALEVAAQIADDVAVRLDGTDLTTETIRAALRLREVFELVEAPTSDVWNNAVQSVVTALSKSEISEKKEPESLHQMAAGVELLLTVSEIEDTDSEEQLSKFVREMREKLATTPFDFGDTQVAIDALRSFVALIREVEDDAEEKSELTAEANVLASLLLTRVCAWDVPLPTGSDLAKHRYKSLGGVRTEFGQNNRQPLLERNGLHVAHAFMLFSSVGGGGFWQAVAREMLAHSGQMLQDHNDLGWGPKLNGAEASDIGLLPKGMKSGGYLGKPDGALVIASLAALTAIHADFPGEIRGAIPTLPPLDKAETN